MLFRSAPKLAQFASLIRELRNLSAELPLPEFYEELVVRTGYGVMLEQKNTVEDRTRLENVRELLSSIQNYLENAGETPTLAGFLDEIALYTDLDSHDPEEDCVVMMTMHSAKGLEFPVVFVVGVEEGIFPGIRSIGEPEEMEEERRLCYVAMTRAKERLHMTCASQRMLFGRTNANRPSRFLGEIPPEFVEQSGHSRYGSSGGEGERPQPAEGGFRRRTPVKRTYDRGYSMGGGYSAPGSGEQAAPDWKSPGTSRSAADFWGFRKGDTVVHKAFGQGLITGLSPIEKDGTVADVLVEIAFDSIGTKKLLLKSVAQFMKKCGE